MLFAYVFLCCISVLEILILDYSFVADFFLARLIMTNALTQSFYFDYLASPQAIIYGSADVTYLIGATYFNNVDQNANTNGFLTALAGSGILTYVLHCIALFIIGLTIQLAFRQSGARVWLILVCLIAFLLVEQKLSVVMVSSGFALPFFYFLFITSSNAKRPS